MFVHALFGAWYDGPTVRAKVNLGSWSEGEKSDPLYINLSEDGHYLLVNLDSYENKNPAMLLSVEPLAAAKGTVSDAGITIATAKATDVGGTQWKGGAVSSAKGVVIPGSGMRVPDRVLGLSNWSSAGTVDLTYKSDGLDFDSFGNLYGNDCDDQNKIVKYEFGSLSSAGGSVSSVKKSDALPLARIRNISVYDIAEKTLVYCGEGSASAGSKGRVLVVDVTGSEWSCHQLLSTSLNGDIMNVKVSGVGTDVPMLYVATDLGEVAIYALSKDGLSVLSPTPVKTVVASELNALFGTSLTSGFRSFEVTNDGDLAFFVLGQKYTKGDATYLYSISSKGASGSWRDDYQIVEFIYAPERSAIRTGVKPNQGTVVEMDVDVQGDSEYWFGVWDVDWNQSVYAFCNDKTSKFCAYGNEGGGVDQPVSQGRHVIKLENGGFYVDGSRVATRGAQTFQLNNDLALFAQNRLGAFAVKGYGYPLSTVRCYGCKIYDGGKLVRDYRPCYRRVGNVSGLYDVVNGTFKPSEWEVAFSSGPVVRDTTLTVVGTPFECGAVVPSYGVFKNIEAGESFTCSALAGIDTETDKTTCTGYVLYKNATGAEDDWKEWYGGGGSSVTFEYPSSEDVKVEWKWNVRRAPSVQNCSASSEAIGSVSVRADVKGIGFGASSADVKLVWWRSLAHGAYTNEIAEMSGVGLFTATVNGLALIPGVSHTAKLLFECNDGSIFESAVFSFVAAASADGVVSLPSGYTQVEYLNSTGLQVINTGVSENDIYGFEFQFTPISLYQQYQTYLSGTLDKFTVGAYNALNLSYVRCFSGTELTHAGSLSTTIKNTYQVRNGVFSLNGSKISDCAKGTRFGSDGSSVYLFNGPAGNRGAAMRFYRLKFYGADGSLTHDFVPCVRGADSVIGICDAVTGAFASNTGSGSFEAGDPALPSLAVTGTPGEFGQPDPDYGSVPALTQGDSFVCWAPPEFEDGDSRAVCTGYRVYAKGEGDSWTEIASGATNEFTYTHSGDGVNAKVEWSWAAMCAVKVTAGDGGTAQSDFSEVPGGGVATLTATPAEGFVFYKWAGDVPAANRFANPLALTVNRPVEVRALFARPGERYWVGSGTDDLASNPDNWDTPGGSGSPTEGADIVFDANANGRDCTWDLDIAVKSWKQVDYAGKVKVATVYDPEGFDCLRVTGDMEILSGTMTHLPNPNGETNRLCVSVGGNMIVAAGAAVNAPTGGGWSGRSRGHWSGSHGGRGLAVQDNPSEGQRECYGSIYTPTNIGARGYLLNNDETIGGGAIRLVVNGTLTVNGTVAADAEPAIAGPAGGAGGSVWLTVGRLLGAGSISANGGKAVVNPSFGPYLAPGAGGRVAAYLTEADSTFEDFTGKIVAFGGYDANDPGRKPVGSCGTVYLQTANEKDRCGRIVIDNSSLCLAAASAAATDYPSSAEGDNPRSARPTLDVTNAGVLNVIADCEVKQLYLTGSTAKINVHDKILYVHSPRHALGVNKSEQVISTGGKIRWNEGMAIILR